MKDNKAPGNDDLSSDVFKIDGDEINKQLVKLYNHILSEKKGSGEMEGSQNHIAA